MKKVVLIVAFIFIFSQNVSADVIDTPCEELLLPITKAEVPLCDFFPDIQTASRVTWCATDRIKKYTTESQFEQYLKIKKNLETFIDDLLFYKGGMVCPSVANYEMQYKFQSFILSKLTADKQYNVPNPYQIHCTLQKIITESPTCLKQDILKICNIQARRSVIHSLRTTSEEVLALFKTITSDVEQQKQWMKEYYNLIHRFVVLIQENEDLMNPIHSSMFMRDWYIYEEMNGRQLEETNKVPIPYPLPFP